jgi:hypothetical protein
MINFHNSPEKSKAEKNILKFSKEGVLSAGDSKFVLGGLVTKARSVDEDNKFRTYLRQLKEETAKRLLNMYTK